GSADHKNENGGATPGGGPPGGGPPGGDKGDSRKLGRNMIADGKLPAPGDEAHHIVAGADRRASAGRDMLQKVGIGINDSDNGVWLSRDLHKTTFSDNYHTTVRTMLEAAGNDAAAIKGVLGQIGDMIKDLVFKKT